mmetsp:Transcript_59106/g.105093  ORF Transcript_59106/g.105093 Transcript_59106/m.105093 type:complete len:407 (+) Transcript_59106:69-1289(+)
MMHFPALPVGPLRPAMPLALARSAGPGGFCRNDLRSSRIACVSAATLAGSQATRRIRRLRIARLAASTKKKKTEARTPSTATYSTSSSKFRDVDAGLEDESLEVQNDTWGSRALKPSDKWEEVAQLLRGEVPAENISGLSTGFEILDPFYKPVRGEFTVVTGVPGSGKSEWLLSVALNMARLHGWRFGTCMFEHRVEDLSMQLLEKVHKCNYRQLEMPLQWDFLQEHFHPIGDFSKELTIDDILDSAKYLHEVYKDDGGLHGLIIDPYNYIEREEAALWKNETDWVSTILTKLKKFAYKYNIHVWMVVHPAKGSNTAVLHRTKNKPLAPSLYDCTGSANWYNKADMGIVVERNRDPEVASTNRVNIHVTKVRNHFAGTPGIVPFVFDWHSRTYYDEVPGDDESDEA